MTVEVVEVEEVEMEDSVAEKSEGVKVAVILEV